MLSIVALAVAGSGLIWKIWRISKKSHISVWAAIARPRMTEESKEISLEAGNRRMDRLIRQHDISVLQTNKHKVAIDDD